ncbi:MAG: hypothetical protein ACSHWN_01335 [Methylophilaceae bacterium]
MQKVTIFGKPGGGKTTLAKRLSKINAIDHYSLDLIEYQADGNRVSREAFMLAHDALLTKKSWVIDGLGVLEAFWKRIEAADTIIYIDLPYWVHYWWVTKRYLMSLIKHPEGWPEGSSVFKGTVASWKYLRLSRKFWTVELLEDIKEKSSGRNFIHITKVQQLNTIR